MKDEFSIDIQIGDKGWAFPVFVIMMTGVILGGAGFFVYRVVETSRVESQCRDLAEQIVREAKTASLEQGVYEASLTDMDVWAGVLTSSLEVSELSNFAKVCSMGRDQVANTTDDICGQATDIHVRKSISKGIESGAKSFGKGMTQGVIEGLGEAKEASVERAKEGVAKVGGLLSKFKKKEKNDPE